MDDTTPIFDAEQSIRVVNVVMGMLMDRLAVKPAEAYAMIAAVSRDTGQTDAQVCSRYIDKGHFG
jgi:hypothetical protein